MSAATDTAPHAQAWQPTAALLSPHWFRLAGARPLLDAGARVQRLVVRGEVWHALVRADVTRSFRLNAAAWSLVGRCDGQLTLQRLWEICLHECGDAAPTQDEVLDLLARLQAAGLVAFDRLPQATAADAAGRFLPPGDEPEAHQRSTWLAWRIPLGCPDRWLASLARRLAPLLRVLGRPAVLLGLGASLLATLVMQASQLSAETLSLSQSPHGLALALLLYPVVKLLHELGHGIVARHHGAPVPQWGISVLMFVPVPYVDASAASALPQARQRLAVAGAGIAVELMLAGLGLLVASQVQPGQVRDAALMLVFIGVLSTLAVNANPLLRFDGYHMLCDAMELPNLATRSHRWWMQALQRCCLQAEPRQPLLAAPGEALWLWAYAPLALAMRWAVCAAVLMWLAGVSVWLGTVTALGFGWALVLRPLWRGWQGWQRAGLPADLQGKARARGLMAGLVLLLVTCVVPWPQRTLAQGVWWLPESALVRTQVEGFVAEVLVQHGDVVAPGDVLLRLESPALESELAQQQARLQALEAEHWQALREDPARAVQLGFDMQALKAEQARTQALLEQRWVRAQAAGPVAIPGESDLPGRWLPRGALVAHVMTEEPPLVKVAVAQEASVLLAQAQPRVQIQRASPLSPLREGVWDGRFSGGGARLPSAALAERSGGPWPTDPAQADGLTPLRALVTADIRVQPTAEGGPTAADRIGERVWVRFDHGHAPLVWQAARRLQQLVLRHVNPAA